MRPSCGIRGLVVACVVFCISGFVQQHPSLATWSKRPTLQHVQSAPPPQQLAALPGSSMSLAADTVDPTSFLSGILGGLIGSDAILLVPIVAAISVAAVIFGFIISYANPQVEDDES